MHAHVHAQPGPTAVAHNASPPGAFGGDQGDRPARAAEIAAQAGAVGYMLKGNPGQLVDAVRRVAAGETAWPPDFTPVAG